MEQLQVLVSTVVDGETRGIQLVLISDLKAWSLLIHPRTTTWGVTEGPKESFFVEPELSFLLLLL